jgi:glucose 1-dehydrogenase
MSKACPPRNATSRAGVRHYSAYLLQKETTMMSDEVNTSGAPVRIIQNVLVGQRALVTGANSGIGRATALALGQAGAEVVVNYVDGDEAANEVVDAIRRTGVNALAYKADVSSEDQVVGMFKAAIQQFGTIDILVNNAGLQRDAAFASMTLAEWNAVIGVNLTGQFLCAREAIREFLRRGIVPAVSCAAGKIICMSSVHQEIPWAGHPNYAASKGGIKLMMESLAQEISPRHIRVNSIAPGAIRTPINTAAWNTKAAYDSLMKLVPYRRIGEPEDIGRAAVWLASDDSDYVVGTTLFVDGGMTLYPGFATGG